MSKRIDKVVLVLSIAVYCFVNINNDIYCQEVRQKKINEKTTERLSVSSRFTVSGYVKDAASGEVLIGANIILKDTKFGAQTNEYGFYSLTVPANKYTVLVSYLGYISVEKNIDIDKQMQLTFELNEVSKALEEIVIEAQKDNKLATPQMSVVKMEMAEIKKVPQLFGEVDVLRTLQFMPGIQTAGEGNSGFSVRGGAVDQNLVELDEATVYNASHLMGFFSVFNSDAIKDLEVFKGGIPAKYGGRLASVVDIRMREGNNRKFHGTGGLGLISSRLMLEGPIVKEKGSWMISGRRTYADLFLRLSADPELQNNALYFYDFNAKANYTLNENNRIYLSGYFGRDVFKFANFFGFDWGNATATVRWNHLFSDKFFSNLTFIYTDFDYNFSINADESGFKVLSGIKDYSVKGDFTYFLSTNSQVHLGLIGIYHVYKPGQVIPSTSSFVNRLAMPDRFAVESAVYAEHEYKPLEEVTLRYGLRYTIFNNIGKGRIFLYDREEPIGENYRILDTVEYSSGKIYNTYNGLEPRFSLSYQLNPKHSFKGSYMRTFQFVQQASNSATTLPTDLWIPADRYIRPQIADQIAIGWFSQYKKDKNQLDISVETFYKWMQNQIDFKDNAQMIFNEALDREIRTGPGRAYGLELMIQKNTGKLTGWISYTYCRTMRTIREINNNNEYYAKTDRPHNVSLVMAYQLNKRVNISTSWVYLSGTPFTVPAGAFEYRGLRVPYYGARNEARLPDYHRLDVSVTIDGKKRPNRRFEDSWNISIYNAYNRSNAYSITFKEKRDSNGNGTGQFIAEQITLFKIIPSVTWNFKF